LHRNPRSSYLSAGTLGVDAFERGGRSSEFVVGVGSVRFSASANYDPFAQCAEVGPKVLGWLLVTFCWRKHQECRSRAETACNTLQRFGQAIPFALTIDSKAIPVGQSGQFDGHGFLDRPAHAGCTVAVDHQEGIFAGELGAPDFGGKLRHRLGNGLTRVGDVYLARSVTPILAGDNSRLLQRALGGCTSSSERARTLRNAGCRPRSPFGAAADSRFPGFGLGEPGFGCFAFRSAGVKSRSGRRRRRWLRQLCIRPWGKPGRRPHRRSLQPVRPA